MKKNAVISILLLLISCFMLSQSHQSIDAKIILAKQLYNKSEKEKALKLAAEIITSSQKEKYSKGIAEGNLINAYHNYVNRNFSKSIEAIKIIEREDYFRENFDYQIPIYDMLCQMYTGSSLTEESMRTARKIVSLSEHSKPENRNYYKSLGYAHLSTIYFTLRPNQDSVYYYNIKTYNLLSRELKLDDNAAVLLSRAALILAGNLKDKKQDSSLFYSQKALEYLPKNFSKSFNSSYYKYVSMIYLINKKNEEAQKYNELYLESQKKVNNLEEMGIAYRLKSISSKTSNDSSAENALKKYTAISEKLKGIKQADMNHIIQHTIKDTIKSKETEIKKAQKKTNSLIVVVITMTVVLLTVIHIARMRFKRKNEEKKQILTEKESEISKLESKVNSAFEEVSILAQNNSPNFITRFQEVYPEFCEKLIKLDPEMQTSEIIFCAYLRLNFSTKEIANYTFVTPKTVQMRKYRLRKKLNIPSDHDINLWMKNIDNTH